VEANRKLKNLLDLFQSKEHQTKVTRCASKVGVNWKFIPVYSPHYGDLWEIAAKSIIIKHHLLRQLSSAVLSFKELYTILAHIGACLNSRRLSPLSSDPCNLNAITPGHFLVGGSLTYLSDQDVSIILANRLRHWQLVTQLTQRVWQRWSRKYLGQLQRRTRWSSNMGPEVKKGMLILIKEPNLASANWHLARIMELHSSMDKVTRTVSVQTQKDHCQHAVRNLCPLPLNYQCSFIKSSHTYYVN
jgi:hypothetical protein